MKIPEKHKEGFEKWRRKRYHLPERGPHSWDNLPDVSKFGWILEYLEYLGYDNSAISKKDIELTESEETTVRVQVWSANEHFQNYDADKYKALESLLEQIKPK